MLKMSEVADLVIVRNFVKSLADAQNVPGEKELRLSVAKMDAQILNAVRDYGREPIKNDEPKKSMSPEQSALFEKQVKAFTNAGQADLEDVKKLQKAIKPKTLKEIAAKNKENQEE